MSVKAKKERRRCQWAQKPLMVEYHDREWGKPVHEDRLLFEFLILEGAQAGLRGDDSQQARELPARVRSIRCREDCALRCAQGTGASGRRWDCAQSLEDCGYDFQ